MQRVAFIACSALLFSVSLAAQQPTTYTPSGLPDGPVYANAEVIRVERGSVTFQTESGLTLLVADRDAFPGLERLRRGDKVIVSYRVEVEADAAGREQNIVTGLRMASATSGEPFGVMAAESRSVRARVVGVDRQAGTITVENPVGGGVSTLAVQGPTAAANLGSVRAGDVVALDLSTPVVGGSLAGAAVLGIQPATALVSGRVTAIDRTRNVVTLDTPLGQERVRLTGRAAQQLSRANVDDSVTLELGAGSPLAPGTLKTATSLRTLEPGESGRVTPVPREDRTPGSQPAPAGAAPTPGAQASPRPRPTPQAFSNIPPLGAPPAVQTAQGVQPAPGMQPAPGQQPIPGMQPPPGVAVASGAQAQALPPIVSGPSAVPGAFGQGVSTGIGAGTSGVGGGGQPLVGVPLGAPASSLGIPYSSVMAFIPSVPPQTAVASLPAVPAGTMTQSLATTAMTPEMMALIRDQGARNFDAAVSALAVHALEVDRAWFAFRDTCLRTTPLPDTGEREWFAIFDGTMARPPDFACSRAFDDVLRVAEPLRAQLDAARDAARRADVLPGHVRDTLLRYNLDF